MKILIAFAVVAFTQPALSYSVPLFPGHERTIEMPVPPVTLVDRIPGYPTTPDRTVPPPKVLLVRWTFPGEARTIDMPVPPVTLVQGPGEGVGKDKYDWELPKITLSEASQIILDSDALFIADGVDITDEVVADAEDVLEMNFEMADSGDTLPMARLKAYAEGMRMQQEQL